MPLLELRKGFTLALVLASSAWAQGPLDGMPPPSAIDACLNKTENSACEFSGRGGSDSGLCVFTGDKKYFACDPHGGKQRPGEGPGANGQEPPPRPGESNDNADNGQEPPPRPGETNENGGENQSSTERGITRFPSYLYSAEE